MLKANIFSQLAQVACQTIVTDEADGAEGADSMTISLALAPVGGGAGAVITSVNVTDLTESVLCDNIPDDLRWFSLVELLSMEVPREGAMSGITLLQGDAI